jgi:5'-nucleotidase
MVQVSGAALRAALEHSVSRPDEEKSGRFLQVSGLRFIFDGRRPPGARVVSVSVRDKPVSNIFSAGAPYDLLSNLPRQIGKPVTKVLSDALGPGKTVAPAPEARITRLSK